MRFVLALAAASAFAAPPSPLESYLGLTEEQLEQVSRNNAEFNDFSRPLFDRIFELQDEFDRELNAATLNPTALDVRYAETQMLFRRMTAFQNKMVASNAALLTAPQLRKLSALGELNQLLPLNEDAHFSGLLGDRCVASPAPPSPGLTAYLQLSPDQIGAILQRQRAATQTNGAAQRRLTEAALAFDRAMSAEPLDPQSLGVRSSARIQAQRDLRALYKQLRTENRSALNEQQRQLLDALTESEKLILEWSEARGTFLEFVLPPPPDFNRIIASIQCEPQSSFSLR